MAKELATGFAILYIFCIDHPRFFGSQSELATNMQPLLCCFKAAAVPLSAVALLFEPHVLESADSV